MGHFGKRITTSCSLYPTCINMPRHQINISLLKSMTIRFREGDCCGLYLKKILYKEEKIEKFKMNKYFTNFFFLSILPWKESLATFRVVFFKSVAFVC